MSRVYIKNHKPKHYYEQDLREFNLREDLPKELYFLDILDGSPPCSAFSMSGKREKDW
jgi:DNA (cytosine-5)-methyltransferase 1